MKVLSLCTEIKGYLPILYWEANERKIDINLIGIGLEWEGWLWRTKKLLSYLKTPISYDREVFDDNIILCDAYDVLVLSDKNEIEKKFADFDCDIVFGCSSTSSGQPYYSNLYKYIIFNINKRYFNTHKDHIINCGMMMGKRSVVIKVLEKIVNYSRSDVNNALEVDDQMILNNIDMSDINFKCDYESKIFWIWEVQTVKELLYMFLFDYTPEYNNYITYDQKGRVIFNSNGNKPCFVHGVSNRKMDKLCTITKKYNMGILNIKSVSQPYIKKVLSISRALCIGVVASYAVYKWVI